MGSFLFVSCAIGADTAGDKRGSGPPRQETRLSQNVVQDLMGKSLIDTTGPAEMFRRLTREEKPSVPSKGLRTSF